MKIPSSLLNELQKKGILDQKTAQSLSDEAVKQDRDLDYFLVDKGIISDEDLLNLKSQIYRLPKIEAFPDQISPEVLRIISEDIARFYRVIPIEITDGTLKVGIINPEDLDALEALKFIAADNGLKIEKRLLSYNKFQSIVKAYSTLTGEVKEALEALGQELGKPETKIKAKAIPEVLTEEAPITRAVAVIIRHAVEGRASDIHIEPQEDKLRIRFRVDGILVTAIMLPKTLHSSITTRIKILSDLKIDETRLPQDGRFSTFIESKKIDFRVSTFPTRHGEKVVLRILDPLVGLVDLPELGLTGRNLKLVEENIRKPFGSILITGPTGSGKTTTLYAMLRKINDEGINIVTLEDPIEFLIDGISQSQVQEEIGYTFASGLRHILRQDPDMIMVGEIRDAETAALATHSALTGHLVLATLHTNDAAGIIPRLVDMGVQQYLIAPTLNLGLAQRLLRKLCQECKIKDKVNVAEEKMIQQALETINPTDRKKYSQTNFTVWRANEKGCKECGGKAYKGRIAIFEVLEITNELEEIILSDLSEAVIRKEAVRQGMASMFQDGILKVLDGMVSLEELLQVAEVGNA